MSHSNHPCTTTPACIPSPSYLDFGSAPFPRLTPCVPYIPIRTSTPTHLFPYLFLPLAFFASFRARLPLSTLLPFSCSPFPLPPSSLGRSRFYPQSRSYRERKLPHASIVLSNPPRPHTLSLQCLLSTSYIQIKSLWFRERITFALLVNYSSGADGRHSTFCPAPSGWLSAEDYRVH